MIDYIYLSDHSRLDRLSLDQSFTEDKRPTKLTKVPDDTAAAMDHTQINYS